MTVQKTVPATLVDITAAGTWRIYARRPGVAPLEITYFRGAPTMYGPYSFADPFGARDASLVFPSISVLDGLGEGDLSWLVYGTDIDIIWDGPLPVGYPGADFAWEGYAESFDYSGEGLTVTLKGAGYQLDNYYAKPGYLQRPMPYEWAIAEQWRDKPDLRLRPLKVVFPSWWTTTYTPPPKQTPAYLIPTHVRPGQKWSALTTRETGSWVPCLTDYIQTLLASMYTERGRFALDIDRYRTPVLRHRDFLMTADSATLEIDPATPGVELSLNVDWSQSLNVAFGQGVSLTGEGYSGQVITHDGSRTTYQPLAALRSVHPVDDRNGWLDTSRMRKEQVLQLQQGLTLAQAQKVGQDHLARFTDPGVTGTIVLTSDPKLGADFLPRGLIKAGMQIHLPRLFGRADGVILHITASTSDITAGSTTLTVDSKFRDALTADEIKLRGRDALAVTRQLIGGNYSPPIPDQLLPWNYSEGSGYIPSGPEFSSLPLFQDMPDDVFFPWTEWTTTHPPSDPAWRRAYMKIKQKNSNADVNWTYIARRESGIAGRYGFPIKLAQAGQIRLVQLAAYDVDGNLLALPFHFSLYNNRGVNVRAMPRITAADLATADGYKVGQHYPFFAGAWERYKADGTQISTEDSVSVSSAGLQRGWGTRDVPAGYWPGSKSAGDVPTGQLQDETTWEFDTTNNVGLSFSVFTPEQNARDAGYWYGMIYCDSPVQDVYFLGRLFRSEPGSTV